MHVRVKRHQAKCDHDHEQESQNAFRNGRGLRFFGRRLWQIHTVNIDVDLAGANARYSSWRAAIASMTRWLKRA